MNQKPNDSFLSRAITQKWLVAAVLLILAAVMRFYRLGEWSYWNDESHTIDWALGGEA